MALTLVTSDLIHGLDYSKLTGTITTWNQNTTGNADTATLAAGATILANTRNINGVPFNGSTNITIADATKLPLAGGTLTGTLGGTSATFSGAISASNLSGTNTGNQTTISGNAGTVTNGVYTVGNQTIGGAKTFSGTLSGTSALLGSDFLANETSKVGIAFASGYGRINSWGADASTYGGLKFQLSTSSGGTFDVLTIVPSGAATFTGGVTISGANNTASKLILTNTASSNTWSFNPEYNSQNFTISEDANPRITLKSGGNVGIGNTNPSRPLDITADSGAVALKLRARSANDYAYMSFYNHENTVLWSEIFAKGTSSATTSLNFVVGATTPQLTISSGGNILIGNPSVNHNYDLQIEGNNILLNTEGSGQLKSIYARYSNEFRVQCDSFMTFYTAGSPTEKMRITSGGHLLIKTTVESGISGGDIGLDNGALRGGVIRARNAANNAYKALIYLDQNDAVQVGAAATGLNITSTGDAHFTSDVIISDRIIGNGKNYATSQSWQPGAANTFSSQTGYYGGNFTNNGSTVENSVIWGNGPFGNRNLQWQTVGESLNDADGGWNKSITGLPSGQNYAYMSYIYVKRTSSATTGTFYYGCGYCLNLNGVANTNPYFHVFGIGSLPQNVWCLAVGIIQAHTDTNTATPAINGVYRMDTKAKIHTGDSYKSISSAPTIQIHRAYHYYSTNPSATLAFANPGFYVVDGSEPNLATLFG